MQNSFLYHIYISLYRVCVPFVILILIQSRKNIKTNDQKSYEFRYYWDLKSKYYQHMRNLLSKLLSSEKTSTTFAQLFMHTRISIYIHILFFHYILAHINFLNCIITEVQYKYN